jgi:hypothetical protein
VSSPPFRHSTSPVECRVTEPVIIRVFSDAAGETHFEEIRLPGETRRSDVSASVAWCSEKVAVRSLVWRRVETEAPSTVPHTAPRRQLIVPLSGAVKIEVSTGEQRTVVPGQILMVDDVTGKGHITRAADDATRVTLMLELADEPFPGPEKRLHKVRQLSRDSAVSGERHEICSPWRR